MCTQVHMFAQSHKKIQTKPKFTLLVIPFSVKPVKRQASQAKMEFTREEWEQAFQYLRCQASKGLPFSANLSPGHHKGEIFIGFCSKFNSSKCHSAASHYKQNKGGILKNLEHRCTYILWCTHRFCGSK